MSDKRLALTRLLAVLAVAFGLVYISWRWTDTLSWPAWWIAVPLVLAETYSLGESVLYALTMWHARRRTPAPPAAPGHTVDVFITTYNEPLEMVMKTAVAARNMTYPHKTWILDDGARPEFEMAAALCDVGYIVRGREWEGKPRLAKAGNINNALFKTTGEFVAILDADQVPEPRFLDRGLGYFADDEVAFVQTPQQFWNVPAKDPLGSQAELFYGPIQQGKDGWGAAFFCGSNAVLRREALMALGLSSFSGKALGHARTALRRARDRARVLLAGLDAGHPARPAVTGTLDAIGRAEDQLRHGRVLTELTYELRESIRAVLGADLPAPVAAELRAISEAVTVSDTGHALAIQPMDTSSITEDMATAMHLHALGWTSVYHHEVLVHGLAPEDVKTMLSQRQRWATGSMQVFFKNNPLFVGGLSLAQRLMYLATMTSYLSGFAAVVYIAAPIIFLTTGVFPMTADPLAFFARFLPFFVCCQLLFQVAGRGSRGLWRGQQMSFALFPTWIAATLAGAAAAFLRRTIAFSVTAKTKQQVTSAYRPVVPQLVAMAVLLVACAIGGLRVASGAASPFMTLLAVSWVALDLALLGVVIGAARYRGPGEDVVEPEVAPAASAGAVESLEVEAPRDRVAFPVGYAPTAGATTTRPEVRRAPVKASCHVLAGNRFGASEALWLLRSLDEAEGTSEMVLLDVSAVTEVTPSGMAGMVGLLRSVRERGGDLRLYGYSPAFSTAHSALNLATVTRVYPGQLEATTTETRGRRRRFTGPTAPPRRRRHVATPATR